MSGGFLGVATAPLTLSPTSLAFRSSNSGFVAPEPAAPRSTYSLPSRPGEAAAGQRERYGPFQETARLDRIDISPDGRAQLRKQVLGQGTQMEAIATSNETQKRIADIHQDNARAVNGTDRGKLLSMMV